MSRIAPYVVLILLLALAGTWILYQGASHDAAAFKQANDELAKTVGALDKEKSAQERIAADALKRRNLAQHERDQAQQALEDAKRHDPTLADYLDSPIHPGAVRLLWPRDGENHQGDAPGIPAGTDAETGLPSVSHQRGWQWCDEMEAAVDMCNGDKAAIRAWAEAQ